MPDDGPLVVYDLVEHLKDLYSIDAKRVYLFGHSAGASFSLLLAMLEPGYFGAAALSEGGLPQGTGHVSVDPAERKPPLILFTSTHSFNVDVARSTRDTLREHGFPVELRELSGGGYYEAAAYINREIWSFLEQHSLENPPYYTEYDFQ